jgi:pimeloyl-ACP methyl ester carboxylesterase
MNPWHVLRRDGVRLVCRDYGGDGLPVLLLHGLAGHSEEWAETASWLTRRHRVVALDARGHGRSERVPADVSPEAHVADAAFVVERLGLSPVVVVGQSLGGVTALGLAADRPDVVQGLVLVDASPAGAGERAAVVVSDLGDALRRWPVPFASRTAAEAFFGSGVEGSLASVAWADGLEQRDTGWWPRFEVGVMTRTLHAALVESRWDAWERISCPTLLVRSGADVVTEDVARDMLRTRPEARLVEMLDAAHDLHLDRPEGWRHALTNFLDGLPRQDP